jgi:hypothetical protein
LYTILENNMTLGDENDNDSLTINPLDISLSTNKVFSKSTDTIDESSSLLPTTATTRKNFGFSSGFVSFFESTSGIRFAVFHVVLFYFVAIVAFSFGWEKWSIIDSLYFATITFTSVGMFVFDLFLCSFCVCSFDM